MARMRGNGILEMIRDDIVTGALPMGARLQIDALASRYGVSHMPVREALRELRGEGLVTMEPNRGARVRELDLAFVENVFDVRNALESLMAQRAATWRSEEDVALMRAAQVGFERAVASGEPHEILRTNRDVHDAIYRGSNNREAFELFKLHWTLITSLIDSHGFDRDRMPGEVTEHAYMIHAIERGDAQAVASVMAAHIERSKVDLLRRLAHRT